MKVPVLRWIDKVVGGLLIILLWLLSLPFPKARLEPRRILVIKLWAMGESIVTLPMIHAIRRRYPGAKITVLCRKRVQDVYAGQKGITVLAREPLSWLAFLFVPRAYDIAIDCEPYLKISAILAWWLGRRRVGFSHGVRSLLYTDRVKYNDEQHAVLTYMDLAAPLDVRGTPKRLVPVATSRADERKVDALFRDWGIKKGGMIVCIAPGAAESSRGRIFHPKRFAKVADGLVKEFLAQVIIIGSKGERQLAEEVRSAMQYNAVNAAGETSVKELASLLKRCALMIGNDSGPMHLAAAMGTRTIGLFCPNTPVRWAPYGPGNEYVYKPVLPKPCINTHLGQLPDCEGHKHMSLITPEDVLQKARKILYARKH